MDKVVVLARVSTQAQDYQRQVTELQEYCDRAGWEVTKVFANKVSGAKAVTERAEIVEMVEYIKSNDIQRVVCLEISRVGRNTLAALKVINYLNENGVSLYVKNYNLETQFTLSRSLTYWIDIQSVMVKKKGHLPMKMSPCAGYGSLPKNTKREFKLFPFFQKASKYLRKISD